MHECMADRAVVVLCSYFLEADPLQDPDARVVPNSDKGSQPSGGRVGQVPPDQGVGNLGGQPTAPVASSNHEAQSAVVGIATEARSANQTALAVRQPPLGPSSRAMFGDVLF